MSLEDRLERIEAALTLVQGQIVNLRCQNGGGCPLAECPVRMPEKLEGLGADLEMIRERLLGARAELERAVHMLTEDTDGARGGDSSADEP